MRDRRFMLYADCWSALYRELTELDLLENLTELDGFGYTIIPPEKVGTSEQYKEAKEAVMRVAARRKGKECAVADFSQFFVRAQENMRLILWEERIFEKVVLTPAALGLIQWLVGTDCLLSLFDGWIKGQGTVATTIHSD